MNTCPKCNSEITINAKFCPECGNSLTTGTPETYRNEATKKSKVSRAEEQHKQSLESKDRRINYQKEKMDAEKQEIINIITKKLDEYEPVYDIAQFLAEHYGIDYEKALKLVNKLYDSNLTKPRGTNYTMLGGILLLTIGLITTIWTWISAQSGGTYYIWFGAIIGGTVLIFRGIIRH
jgi:hypothetical protein